MGRINGANSDYRFNGQGVVEDITDPLFMKIFICPYDKPNSLQDLNGEPHACEGTDQDCPETGTKTGHAMIQLHKVDGIKLVTDNENRIWIKQNGDIELGKPGGGSKIILKANGEIDIEATNVNISGTLTVIGNVTALNI